MINLGNEQNHEEGNEEEPPYLNTASSSCSEDLDWERVSCHSEGWERLSCSGSEAGSLCAAGSRRGSAPLSAESGEEGPSSPDGNEWRNLYYFNVSGWDGICSSEEESSSDYDYHSDRSDSDDFSDEETSEGDEERPVQGRLSSLVDMILPLEILPGEGPIQYPPRPFDVVVYFVVALLFAYGSSDILFG
ncbi:MULTISPECIES: hypothetical protein [Candidatus Ichthyocystis]|uniref:hypothetical protein n=1 Tax=Candidatus Ichthyocystis TaxID=2929841 RepID=UPI000B81D4F8|nr:MULTISPECIES: hypothetical protein [Ichthyocystis]